MKKSFLLFILSCLLCSCSYAKNDDNKMMASRDIIKLINKGKPVQIVDRIITDDLDFTSIDNKAINANGNVNHSVNQDITFVKCVFLGKVITNQKKDRALHKTKFMGDVSFRTCDFRGVTDFNGSVVNGDLNFAQSVFRENTNFNNLCVKGNNAQFWEIQSEKDFSMVNSKIFGSLNLMDAHFSGICLLQQTNCDKFQFSNAICDSMLDMSMSKFEGNVFMNYCTISGQCSFNDCDVKASFDLLNSSFKQNVNFDNSIFYGKARFNGTQFASNVSANEVYFLISPKFENIKINNPLTVNKLSSSTIEIK